MWHINSSQHAIQIGVTAVTFTVAVSVGLAASGYGFYRPQMTLFDPGWRGEQARGPEDWGVADLGNDPMGIIDR